MFSFCSRAPISTWFLLALVANAAAAQPLDSQYLRDHAHTRGFMLGRPVGAQPTPDGKSVLFLRAEARVPKMKLYEFDVGTGQTRELLSPETVLKGAEEKLSPEEKARRERMRVSVGGITNFQLSDDGRLILLSISGKLYKIERETRNVRELRTGAGTIIDPKFSPDTRKIAYVRDHDVYAYDLARDKESRVTTGGSERVTHGLAEFVAQEEMDRHTGYWWSPDSRFIAFEEADATDVEIWHVADPANPGQQPHPSFYPRPGKNNVRVRVGVVPVRGGKPVWIRWDSERYPYLTQVRWSKIAPLTITVQTRDQRELVLMRVDPKSGATAPLVTERDAAFLNLDQQVPRWLEDGSAFLWTSERDGAPQLELRTRDGALQRVIVPPTAGYQGLAAVDDRRREIVFRASVDPTQVHIFRTTHAGGAAEQLTREAGQHGATFSKDHALYVRSTALGDAMPRSTVHRADGTLIGELPSVAEGPPFTPRVEILKTSGGREFYAKIVRPQNFDPAKRYPVIDSVYGGPHAKTVSAAMNAHLLNQWLADQGFIVVSIDNRGTPGRGRDWERAIYKKFGSVPLEDQVAGLKALGERFPELDLERVGIVGWSFGGYMSALAVLRQPDVFKAAVAGAPVTVWEDYDTHYTERYMGFPDSDADAYREGSLLTYADKLSRPLLLVHGTSDDNVYFRHTLRLTDALFRAGKHFEVLPLSSLTHMVPDPTVMENLWGRTAQHFKRHLGEPR